MGVNGRIDVTYKGYLEELHQNKEPINEKYIQEMLLQYKQLSSLSIVLPNSPVLFALDYCSHKYIYFSNSLGSYQAETFLNGGTEFKNSIMQKDYFKLFNEEVFPAILTFFKNVPQIQHSNYIVSYNNRILTSDEQEVNFYQRSSYITNKETGLPVYCIGMLIDMSHFKTENSITLSFEKLNKENGLISLIEKRLFYPYKDNKFITKQEKSILQLMAEGLNSKMIAQKLDISCKTIENHRANMLRKTNTINVAQLIAFAFQNKII
jgi:DNA-binding CsgD family transcriptional regulator